MSTAGTRIQKDTKAVIFAYGLHHNPIVYPDPEKFDPERFAGPTNRSPYAYIPFSVGSRNCIGNLFWILYDLNKSSKFFCLGQKFAILEMKTTISKLLRNFEIHPATLKSNLELEFETVLVSGNGINVTLKNR